MNNIDISNLPVFSALDEITLQLRSKKIIILSAEPGAGKTTLIPWHFINKKISGSQKILLLEPRRIAARTAADRIASLLGEETGKTVGLRTRRETIISADTKLEVVTEGILVRMLQSDQSLEGYGIIIFDEFHERSLAADTGLAFALDCRETVRPDLMIVIMSATIPSDGYSIIGDAPVVKIPGREYPVSVSYHPPFKHERIWDGAARLAAEAYSSSTAGHLLVFLPGWKEIARTNEILSSDPRVRGAAIEILHGSLPAETQRRVVQYKGPGRMIVLSTNIAQTSITIAGITAVVDSGRERRVSFSPSTGMDHRDTVMISAASAEQRKGRAGRTGPGICLRLWDESEQLEEYTPPEILRADLSALLLETAAWGAKTPADLKWITAPPASRLERADGLLRMLDMLDSGGKITPSGKAAAAYGLNPRTAKIIIEAVKRGFEQTAAACTALLSEGDGFFKSESDFSFRLSEFKNQLLKSSYQKNSSAARIKDEAVRILKLLPGRAEFDPLKIEPDRAGEVLLPGYPDMTAARAATSGAAGRRVFSGGRGASAPAVFSSADFIVAVEIDGGESEAKIFCAAGLSLAALMKAYPDSKKTSVRIEWRGWSPLVTQIEKVMGFTVKEKTGTASPEEILEHAARRIKKDGISCLPWDDASREFLDRCGYFFKHTMQSDKDRFSRGRLVDEAADWLFPFAEFDGPALFDADILLKALEFRAGYESLRVMQKNAPESVQLPTGSSRRLDYSSGEIPVLRVRIQEVFGLGETPRVCGEPVLVHLLSPAGRPVQITDDLGGFWKGSYSEVRKEMAGRYPKHRWPEDPLNAEPSLLTKKKMNSSGPA